MRIYLYHSALTRRLWLVRWTRISLRTTRLAKMWSVCVVKTQQTKPSNDHTQLITRTVKDNSPISSRKLSSSTRVCTTLFFQISLSMGTTLMEAGNSLPKISLTNHRLRNKKFTKLFQQLVTIMFNAQRIKQTMQNRILTLNQLYLNQTQRQRMWVITKVRE